MHRQPRPSPALVPHDGPLPISPTSDRQAASPGFIAEAAESCRRRGLNLTPIRRRVLEVIAESSMPVSAYAIIERLSDRKLLSPPTVYRALEFLIEAGFVRHVALRKAYIRREPWSEDPMVTLLLCTECGGVSEAASGSLWQTFMQIAATTGFMPCSRAIEIEGRCATCCSLAPGCRSLSAPITEG